MLFIKAAGVAILIPFLVSLFLFSKEMLVRKKEIVYYLIKTSDSKSFSAINLTVALLITFAVLFALFFTLGIVSISKENVNNINSVSTMITYVFLGAMFYRMIYIQKIHTVRSILFLLLAIGFSIDFIGDMYEARGHFMFFSAENMIQGEMPKCHLSIVQSVLPVVLKRIIVYPGKISLNGIGITYTIGAIVMLWVASSLALGRGWCSWMCFFGGWEDGFSSLKKKAVLKCNTTFKLLPVAIFIVIVCTSLFLLHPVYCTWLCPFKAVTEYAELKSSIAIIQMMIFLTIFIGLVVVLPILTKKRTQCAFFCPFGILQSLIDKVNIFSVRIDKEKCIDCKLCIDECPVLSVSEKSLAVGEIGFTCVKCGKCIDVCPEKAISFHIKGTPKKGPAGAVFSSIARYSFLIVALVFFGTFGGGEIRDGLCRILMFFTTGSFVQ